VFIEPTYVSKGGNHMVSG